MKRRERVRRITIIVVAAVIVVSLVVGFYFALNTTSPYASFVGKQVSGSIMNDIAGVSDATLSSIGAPAGVTPPTIISGSTLTVNGKPEVLYVGGDYCPYCAVERWSLIMALSRFGTFSNVTYMLSSAADVNPNTPTFSFAGSTYTSSYLVFVGVEEFGADSNTIRQPLTSDQQSLVTQFDTCASTGQRGGIPFIDIANTYAVNCGAQSSLDVSNKNWTDIAPALDTPNSNTARLIDGAANTLITAICKVETSLGKSPPVCSQSYANVTLSYVAPTASGPAAFAIAAPPSRMLGMRLL